MIRYHHITALRLFASTVHKTAPSEEGALVTQAFIALGADTPTRNCAVVDFQRIHVVVVALLYEGEQARQGGSLVDFLLAIMDDGRTLVHQAIDFAQTRVMAESLQRRIRNAQRLRKKRQFLMNKLVKKSIGFRGHTNRDAVLLRSQCQRNQVRHRLANARTRFDCQIARSRKGMVNGKSHFTLLFMRLVFFVQAT